MSSDFPSRQRGAASRSSSCSSSSLLLLSLAAILFPVFQKVRENARRAACESNLHQLGLAFTQYTQDCR